MIAVVVVEIFVMKLFLYGIFFLFSLMLMFFLQEKKWNWNRIVGKKNQFIY